MSPPFAGHLNPQLPLAEAARDAGYAIHFITGEAKQRILTERGFDVTRLSSLGGDRLEAIANWPRRVGSNPVLLLRQFRQNLALLPAIREELLTAWRAEAPDLVVADSVAPVAGMVCDELGVPWITTIATPFAIENRRGVPAYCGGWSPGGEWRRVRDAAGRLAIRSFKRAVFRWFRREFREMGITRPYREDGTESIYSSRAILGFGIEELEFDRDWPPAFRMIGPVVDSPEACPELSLSGTGKRVLVTLGTHLLWAKRSLVDDVITLAASMPGVDFVVSLGAAGGESSQPAPRVTVYPFVPYARDLRRFDAVMHHGGAGVTYAAILAGVPSVVVPHDYDQFDFAARVVDRGLGLRAKSVVSAKRALGEVLEREWPEVDRFRRLAGRYRPGSTFLEAIKSIVGSPGETAYQ